MKKALTISLFLAVSISSSIGALSVGDVNSSGGVDIVDALLVAQYYVGLNPANFLLAAADVNCDSAANIVDALIVSQYYVGIITSFPSCPAPSMKKLTVEITGKDYSITSIDLPYIDPPDVIPGGSSSIFIYADGTIVNCYVLSSTPPPRPVAGQPPVRYQGAGFTGYTGSFNLAMTQDQTIRIQYTTFELPSPDGTTPAPTPMADGYVYMVSEGVCAVDPEITTNAMPIIRGGQVASSIPGYTGTGYVELSGSLPSIGIAVQSTVSPQPYYSVGIRMWDTVTQAWIWNKNAKPDLLRFDTNRAGMTIYFRLPGSIVDRIVVFQEGTPESVWQDLNKGQATLFTGVNNMPSASFILD